MPKAVFLFVTGVWLTVLFVSCQPEREVLPVASLIAPASSPKTYPDYAAVADLFRQPGDTTYVINFWATWCRPCLEELPLLQQLQDRRATEPLRVILVSLDTEAAAIDRIPAFLENNDIDLPTIVLTDESPQWQREIDEKWDGSLPTTLIYRKGLRYIYRRPFMSMPDLAAAVSPLLSQ